MSEQIQEKFIELVNIMKRLRAPGGCPWDREQTYDSLRRYIIEEAYELVDAIEKENKSDMCEESGDLLLQVVFVSCIAAEHNDFDICDVMDYISQKLIRRHPHVFGDTQVKNSDDVVKNWEQIKVGERKDKHTDPSLLAGIPRALPALLNAYRMQERAAKVGFDWPQSDYAPVLDKVNEELGELKNAIVSNDRANMEEEVGDAIFALVNLARHIGVDPESATRAACEKFASRFRYVEERVAESKREWSTFSLDELDAFWKLAKERKNQREQL